MTRKYNKNDGGVHGFDAARFSLVKLQFSNAILNLDSGLKYHLS